MHAYDAQQCGHDGREDDAAVPEGVAHGQQAGANVPSEQVQHCVCVPGTLKMLS